MNPISWRVSLRPDPFFLVPKLHLGTRVPAKLCFAARATELRGQVRSQVQLGNEERGGNP